MTGHRITANLPSRDFDRTEAFYGRLGLSPAYRDAAWMILRGDGLELEFFSHPDLDPSGNWFSACLRSDDPDTLLSRWQALDLPEAPGAIPRLTGFVKHGPGVPRMFALVDPDGSLIRCIDEKDDT